MHQNKEKRNQAKEYFLQSAKIDTFYSERELELLERENLNDQMRHKNRFFNMLYRQKNLNFSKFYFLQCLSKQPEVLYMLAILHDFPEAAGLERDTV